MFLEKDHVEFGRWTYENKGYERGCVFYLHDEFGNKASTRTYSYGDVAVLAGVVPYSYENAPEPHPKRLTREQKAEFKKAFTAYFTNNLRP